MGVCPVSHEPSSTKLRCLHASIGEDASDRDPFYEYPLFSKNGTFFGNGATAGAGLNLPAAGLTLDYAFTGISFMDNIHRFSLGYRFSNSLL